MESELQTPPAAEAASSGQSESTASAPSPSAFGGPNSWESAFAAEDVASNSDSAPATREPSAPAAAPAASSDAAPDAAGAPTDQGQEAPKADARPDDATPAAGDKPAQPEPQPGSRRSTAAELEAQRQENAQLREQFEAWAKERDEQRAAEAKRAEDEAAAKAAREAEVESLLGKPGEMAALLQKRAQAQRSGNWADFTQDDEDRLTRLTEGALLYQPLQERARREAEAQAQGLVAEAQGQAQALMQAWASQFEQAAGLDLPSLDASALKKAADIPALVRVAHAAGAASRDGEIAELQGRLTDAQARAFTSQPQPATGGVSGNGRTERGYDPTRSPVSNLESVFAEEAMASPNGRR